MDTNKLTLIDFGNTHATIYQNGTITKVKVEEFDFSKSDFYYINVNSSIKDKLKGTNIESYIKINSNYQGLGVDRKLLCSYISDGVIVDAGSAITVDVMRRGEHKGGFIYPGIRALCESYKNISPLLEIKRDAQMIQNKLPNKTKAAIKFGIFYPIVLAIKEISKDYKIYFCGGDGKELSKYFENSSYHEDLVFKAMKKIIKENIC